jgi:uncharacterized membrane protein
MVSTSLKGPCVELDELSETPPFTTTPRRLIIALGALLVLGFLLAPPLEPLDKANLVGYSICHQIPDRSFYLGEHRLPLCARCTGTYLGVGIGFAFIALLGRWRSAGMLTTPLLVAMVAFIVIMGVDGINSYLYLVNGSALLYEPRNWLRAITGSLNGIALSHIVLPVFNYTLWKDPQEDLRPLRNGRELLALLGVVTLAVAVVQSEPAWLLYPVAILTTAGVLAMLTLVNTMILLIALKRDSQAHNWHDALPGLLLGLVAALIELSAMGTLRYLVTGTLAWPL